MIYLAVITALAIVATLTYLVAYGWIANWRDEVAVNAWLGGLGPFLLCVASAFYVAGHYGIGVHLDGDIYMLPFLIACLGFTIVALVWTHRTVIVLVKGERPAWRALLNFHHRAYK